MTVKKFFQIPAVQFVVHIIIISGLIVNIIQFYKIWHEKARIQKTSTELSIINNIAEDLRHPDNYLSSDFYKEKYAKEEMNMRKNGENILDTSQFEGTTIGQRASYTPLNDGEEKTNIEKWIDCFFGQDRLKYITPQ